jgi:hypothetical protein
MIVLNIIFWMSVNAMIGTMVWATIANDHRVWVWYKTSPNIKTWLGRLFVVHLWPFVVLGHLFLCFVPSKKD